MAKPKKAKEPLTINYERLTITETVNVHLQIDGMTPASLQEVFDKQASVYTDLHLATDYVGYNGEYDVVLKGSREENDEEYTNRIAREMHMLKQEEKRAVAQSEKDLAEFKRLEKKLKKQGIINK